jgi:basic membrane protein A
VLAFGTNKDQNHLAPEVTLASATLDIPSAFLLLAREVRDGRFEPRQVRFGLRDGVVGIAWNGALSGRVPPEVDARARELVARITSGELEVPRAGF